MRRQYDAYHGGQEFFYHRQSFRIPVEPHQRASSMDFAKIGLNRK